VLFVSSPTISLGQTPNNWELFYNGWTAGEFENNTYVCDNVCMAISSWQQEAPTPCFFYQLLFPFCDKKMLDHQ
jgi:hypothetical protein